NFSACCLASSPSASSCSLVLSDWLCCSPSALVAFVSYQPPGLLFSFMVCDSFSGHAVAPRPPPVLSSKGSRTMVGDPEPSPSSARSGQQVLDDLRHTVVAVGGRDTVGRLLHDDVSVGHREAPARPTQHLDVVARVAEGEHLVGCDAEVLAQPRQPPGLVD